MNYEGYTAAIQDLLNEANGTKHLDVELHPSWDYPILDACNVGVGYKLRRRTGQQPRTMSLAVDIYTGFVESAGGKMVLTPNARQQIIDAIESFWRDGNSERHTFVDVG